MSWVSVKDRLPDEDVDVLVCDINHLGAPIAVGKYSPNPNWSDWETDSDFWQGSSDLDVTHWMPLPTNPQERD